VLRGWRMKLTLNTRVVGAAGEQVGCLSQMLSRKVSAGW